MKGIKIIFIAIEIAAILGVIWLAFSHFEDEEAGFFQSMFISLFAILAVTFQREQQDIDWYECEDE